MLSELLAIGHSLIGILSTGIERMKSSLIDWLPEPVTSVLSMNIRAFLLGLALPRPMNGYILLFALALLVALDMIVIKSPPIKSVRFAESPVRASGTQTEETPDST